MTSLILFMCTRCISWLADFVNCVLDRCSFVHLFIIQQVIIQKIVLLPGNSCHGLGRHSRNGGSTGHWNAAVFQDRSGEILDERNISWKNNGTDWRSTETNIPYLAYCLPLVTTCTCVVCTLHSWVGTCSLLSTQSTVDSRCLEVKGTLWNTSRHPYLDLSDLQIEETNQTTTFNKWVCNLTPEVRDTCILKILWKTGEITP